MSRLVEVTELALRDGHQSLLATRMRTEDMLPIAQKLDVVGYWSLEVWGGATFDTCLRFLKEDPWERLRALRLPHKVMKVSGTSEDMAFLLAHGRGANLIVAVGSHGNLREFLDKGRMGMASTFLVRLRVGDVLVDAKGVSRMYRATVRGRDAAMLVVAALIAIAVVIAISPPLRLLFKLLFESVRQLVFRLTH